MTQSQTRTDASLSVPDAHPILKPHLRIEVVPPKTVYLLGELGSSALTGGLYCQIVPLLDGTRTVADVHDALDGGVPLEHVSYVVDRLKTSGYVVDAAPSLSRREMAFWTQMGASPGDAAAHLGRARISVTAIGETDAGPLIARLETLGMSALETSSSEHVAPEADLAVAVVDDYLRPELDSLNREMLAAGAPWIVTKPAGTVAWLGPLFAPGETGCWGCLSQRLKDNDEVRQSILRQRSLQRRAQGTSADPDEEACLSNTVAGLATMHHAALALLATEIAKALVMRGPDEAGRGIRPPLHGTLVTVDQSDFTVLHHPLPHRPQCPACGDPSLLHERGFRPVGLGSTPKSFTRDGGHRSVTPEQTLARFEHLIDPLTGIVSELTRVSGSDDRVVHNYHAGRSLAGRAGNLSALRLGLRLTNGGKGKTDVQSRASGFCEAIERYSGVYQGDEPRHRASYDTLSDEAIHPESYLCFSEHQYDNRDGLNSSLKGDNAWIPERFDPKREIDWTPVWSLTRRRRTYFPTALSYYGVPTPPDHRFAYGDSNGCAAGNTLEEAALQGFLELIERDSVAIWWYNEICRPSVDLDSFDEAYFRELTEYYKDRGRDVWVLDVTGETGIPAFVAVSQRTDVEEDRVIVRFGAHLDARIGIERALTELNQGCVAYDGELDDRLDQYAREWLFECRVKDHAYLLPDPERPGRTPADYHADVREDIRDDVMDCVDRVAELGLETFLLDQTRPDIGLNVVKVIVPGLRHYWPRFGPGRLYDAPVKLGWRSAALDEGGLNQRLIPAF